MFNKDGFMWVKNFLKYAESLELSLTQSNAS